MKPPLRILLGPTASGKERVALAIAEAEGAHIVSVDSMKIYREMVIGTAAPTGEMRARVPHHCVGMVDPDQAFSVAEYRAHAEAALEAVESVGGTHILSGGTALYYKALVEGLFDGPSSDPALRAQLEAEAEADGNQALHTRLARVDPEAAERIHPNDLRRIVRALEVVETTGKPISVHQAQFGAVRSDRPVCMVGLRWPREVLHRRIAERVDRMRAAGLVDEARRLYARRPPVARQARAAVGYAELFAHFDGEHDPDTAFELICRNTRRLAKSQMTWFRKFDCRWVELDASRSTGDVADAVREAWAGQEAGESG